MNSFQSYSACSSLMVIGPYNRPQKHCSTSTHLFPLILLTVSPQILGMLFHLTGFYTLLTLTPSHRVPTYLSNISRTQSWSREGHSIAGPMAQSRKRNPIGFAFIAMLCSPRASNTSVKLALLSRGEAKIVRKVKPAGFLLRFSSITNANVKLVLLVLGEQNIARITEPKGFLPLNSAMWPSNGVAFSTPTS